MDRSINLSTSQLRANKGIMCTFDTIIKLLYKLTKQQTEHGAQYPLFFEVR